MTHPEGRTSHLSTHRPRRAFYLLEVVIVIFIVFAMALMFAAVVPTSLRSVMTGSTYALAAEIAQRKLDQLMDPSVGYNNLTAAALETAGIIGHSSTTTDPDPVTVGTFGTSGYTMTGYFTYEDGLRYTSAAGSSGNALPGESAVLGTLTCSSWYGSTSGSTPKMMEATVTITWNNPGQGPSSFTQSCLIPSSSAL